MFCSLQFSVVYPPEMRCFLSFAFVLLISVVSGSSECSDYDFPCEDGGCVDSELWCDSHKDCSDGSDEKYCRKSNFKKDPNKCPTNYFKCDNGPCIPMVGRCDGYKNCEDSSDEQNCEQRHSSSKSDGMSSPSVTVPLETRTTSATTSKTTTRTTTNQPRAQVKSSPTNFSDSPGAVQHSVEIMYSDSQHSDYSQQREEARKWFLSQRRSDFGWGDETPRALTALYLSDLQRSIDKDESDMLMVKQLEVQLALDMSRNGTKTMKLTDLALYINALLASCKDPKNFYGENLVNTLRNGVNSAHRETTFVNPSVYLTLCLNNATTHDDTRKLHELFLSRNAAIGRIDIQALTMLTITCIYRNTNLFSESAYDGIRRKFLQKMNTGGLPGNVYEASLLVQALQELESTLPGLPEFILKQQKEDGSFGSILATYLALPVLAGRSLLQMNEHCGQRFSTDLAPIEVLKNTKRRRMFVQYSLNYDYPLEVTETINMRVAEGTKFLDVMRLAQEINPKFRFMLDGNREVPVVYSIGGIPNDAEKGKYWTLYLAPSGRVKGEAGRLAAYSGNIKQLIPHAGDEFVFWMKSL